MRFLFSSCYFRVFFSRAMAAAIRAAAMIAAAARYSMGMPRGCGCWGVGLGVVGGVCVG